jgi:hypothetical protein
MAIIVGILIKLCRKKKGKRSKNGKNDKLKSDGIDWRDHEFLRFKYVDP